MMQYTRRQFLKKGITFVSLSLTANYMMMAVSPGSNTVFGQASASSTNENLLVVVQLVGGNDGLNTVIPYGDGHYYDARPSLAVPESQILTINGQIGLHPNLKGLKALYDQGKLAIVQGVGYANPILSHFRATDIWESAHPEAVVGTGWLGRYLDQSIAANHPSELPGAMVGGPLPLTLVGSKVVVPAIISLDSYKFQTDSKYPNDAQSQIATFTQINTRSGNGTAVDYVAQSALDGLNSSTALQKATANYRSTVTYGTDPFSQGLKLVSQIIAGGLSTQVLYVTIGGFDTHSAQHDTHEKLLSALDAGLSAFYQDLVAQHVSKGVTIMSFSEFGRRVKENGSKGTDHGTAAPMFVLGDPVKGGLYGQYPSLSQLDSDGNLIYNVDFRSVYSTIISDWLKADPKAILDGSYENLGFIAG
jgi:uncharacterized protein (DUF1501 family)